MLKQHKDIFFRIANQLNCLIGLREPNSLADRWITRAGYVPKSQDCKAKTSNNADFRFGGLVVDPVLCPEAFTPSSLSDALDKWHNKFIVAGNLPTYFSRETTGFEKGLVKYKGFPIHSDYDLMYICKADRRGKATYTDLADQQRLFLRAQGLLNMYFGRPMIQHGTELSWSGGVGAAESEYVYLFAPRTRFSQTLSTVSKNPKDWH